MLGCEVKMKLNLGCGNKKMFGFINVDGREDIKPDVICDISSISKKFKDVDLIYASHVLEHFPYKPHTFYKTTCHDLLKDWHKTLKIGGTLRISVPDFESVCKYYIYTNNLSPLKTLINGGQKYDFDFHLSCWDFETLKLTLEDIGFKNVRKYDWKNTEHNYIDDYSQAYLPHMDKVNGKLMSLNVEADR
jgi:predicted SAM-dependent methyltransferase